MVFPKEKSICWTYLAFRVENRLQSFNLSFKISLSIWDRHFGSLKIIFLITEKILCLVKENSIKEMFNRKKNLLGLK